MRNAYILSTSDTISTRVGAHSPYVPTHARQCCFVLSIYLSCCHWWGQQGGSSWPCLPGCTPCSEASKGGQSQMLVVCELSAMGHTRCERANNKRYTNEMNEPQHTEQHLHLLSPSDKSDALQQDNKITKWCSINKADREREGCRNKD